MPREIWADNDGCWERSENAFAGARYIHEARERELLACIADLEKALNKGAIPLPGEIPPALRKHGDILKQARKLRPEILSINNGETP